MNYHAIEQTEQGDRIVKSYASQGRMWQGLKPNKPRWIIFCQRSTLDGFSSIGMPNTWYWNGYHMEEKRMPVLPLIRN
jgi:hypothetical protein